MRVRRETTGDHDQVDAVHAAAFASESGGVPVEVSLLHALRADDAWIDALSLVADVDGTVIGHVTCTRGRVGDAPALGLGPIGVTPKAQGQGVGSALMHAVLAVAEAAGETVVCLLGDPGYYERFGFAAASQLGIESPDPAWAQHFQAVALTGAAVPVGRFRYASPFDDLG